MKLLIPIFLFVIVLSAPAFGQSATDSLKADMISQPVKGFVDENGDGIDDRLEGKGKRLQRGKARFIDNDGDGICDGRESGLGFRGGRTEGGTGKGSGGRQWRGGRK